MDLAGWLAGWLAQDVGARRRRPAADDLPRVKAPSQTPIRTYALNSDFDAWGVDAWRIVTTKDIMIG